MEARVRRYFPGGNTPKGYLSFFDQAITWNRFQRIFIIKGGPGVGKSTMMRYMASELLKKGINLEILHCTADSTSLDGVVLVDHDIAILDGTPPHMMDPKVPGCVDEIINLGLYWNEEGLKQNKDKIIGLQKSISSYYKRAYSYLTAAKTLLDDLKDIYIKAADFSANNIKTEEILHTVYDYASREEKISTQRHMFASAITPEGSVNFLDILFQDVKKRFIITGYPGTGKSTLLKRVLDQALVRGYDVEIYYCAIDPEKIEHLIIKDLDIGFITSIKPHEFAELREEDTIIDLNVVLDYKKLESQKDAIEYNNTVYENLYNEAIRNLTNTKKVRYDLEKLYYTNMNFKTTEEIRDQLLLKIYNLIGK